MVLMKCDIFWDYSIITQGCCILTFFSDGDQISPLRLRTWAPERPFSPPRTLWNIETYGRYATWHMGFRCPFSRLFGRFYEVSDFWEARYYSSFYSGSRDTAPNSHNLKVAAFSKSQQLPSYHLKGCVCNEFSLRIGTTTCHRKWGTATNIWACHRKLPAVGL